LMVLMSHRNLKVHVYSMVELLTHYIVSEQLLELMSAHISLYSIKMTFFVFV
jgi:hypothetical protein